MLQSWFIETCRVKIKGFLLCKVLVRRRKLQTRPSLLQQVKSVKGLRTNMQSSLSAVLPGSLPADAGGADCRLLDALVWKEGEAASANAAVQAFFPVSSRLICWSHLQIQELLEKDLKKGLNDAKQKNSTDQSDWNWVHSMVRAVRAEAAAAVKSSQSSSLWNLAV